MIPPNKCVLPEKYDAPAKCVPRKKATLLNIVSVSTAP